MEFFKLIFAKSEIKKLKYLKINKILNETQMPIIKNNFELFLFSNIKFPIKKVCKTEKIRSNDKPGLQ